MVSPAPEMSTSPIPPIRPESVSIIPPNAESLPEDDACVVGACVAGACVVGACVVGSVVGVVGAATVTI